MMMRLERLWSFIQILMRVVELIRIRLIDRYINIIQDLLIFQIVVVLGQLVMLGIIRHFMNLIARYQDIYH